MRPTMDTDRIGLFANFAEHPLNVNDGRMARGFTIADAEGADGFPRIETSWVSPSKMKG